MSNAICATMRSRVLTAQQWSSSYQRAHYGKYASGNRIRIGVAGYPELIYVTRALTGTQLEPLSMWDRWAWCKLSTKRIQGALQHLYDVEVELNYDGKQWHLSPESAEAWRQRIDADPELNGRYGLVELDGIWYKPAAAAVA